MKTGYYWYRNKNAPAFRQIPQWTICYLSIEANTVLFLGTDIEMTVVEAISTGELGEEIPNRNTR